MVRSGHPDFGRLAGGGWSDRHDRRLLRDRAGWRRGTVGRGSGCGPARRAPPRALRPDPRPAAGGHGHALPRPRPDRSGRGLRGARGGRACPADRRWAGDPAGSSRAKGRRPASGAAAHRRPGACRNRGAGHRRPPASGQGPADRDLRRQRRRQDQPDRSACAPDRLRPDDPVPGGRTRARGGEALADASAGCSARAFHPGGRHGGRERQPARPRDRSGAGHGRILAGSGRACRADRGFDHPGRAGPARAWPGFRRAARRARLHPQCLFRPAPDRREVRRRARWRDDHRDHDRAERDGRCGRSPRRADEVRARRAYRPLPDAGREGAFPGNRHRAQHQPPGRRSLLAAGSAACARPMRLSRASRKPAR